MARRAVVGRVRPRVSFALVFLLVVCAQIEGAFAQAGVPLATKDTLQLVAGQLTYQRVDDLGSQHKLQAIPSRVEVIANDKILGYTQDSCFEYARPQATKPQQHTKVQFVEAGDGLGLTFYHRSQKPVRPYCLFDFSVPQWNGSAYSKLSGEFCTPEQISGAVAAGDFDDDGLVDLFFTGAEGRSALYKNLGGTFKDVSLEVGVGPAKYASGAVWADVDADGDLDLYVTCIGDTRHYLYINRGGVFKEEAVLRNMSLEQAGGRRLSGMTPNAGDYDRDGFADLYVSEWIPRHIGYPSASVLMHNIGKKKPGYFEDVTKSSLVDMDSFPPPKGTNLNGTFAFCSSFTDLDNDGWGDILVTADNKETRLFWNNRNGSFHECTTDCGIVAKGDTMGHAMGDVNMDGLMDWWLTSIHVGDTNVDCSKVHCTFEVDGNIFYRNLGGRKLFDDTNAIGVRAGYWGWGNALVDFNNDRWLDFIMTNGFDTGSTTTDDAYSKDPTRLWENLGPQFNFSTVERSSHYGIAHKAEGRGLLKVDIDDDGDEDIIIVNHIGKPTVYRNDGGNQNDWLKITVKHQCPNDQAIMCDSLGARVYVKSPDGYTQMKEVGSGSQFMAQEELKTHFGLGNMTARVSVRVSWPWLHKELNITDVPPNTRLRLVAPRNDATNMMSYASLAQCPRLTIHSVTQPPVANMSVHINPDEVSLKIALPINSDGSPVLDLVFPNGTAEFQYTLKITPSASASDQFSTTTVKIQTVATTADYVTCPTSQLVPDPDDIAPTTNRSIDGWSNNIKNPIWGAATANLNREVSAAYSDAISVPAGECTYSERVGGKCMYPTENARRGSQRPSGRSISNAVFQQTENVYSKRGLSDLHTHFGQFLAHDTDFSSPLPRFEFLSLPSEVWFPISIPKGDVHFDPYGLGDKYMSFVRTTFSSCTARVFKRPREQFNKISSIIDATSVYGDASRLKHLRTHKGGKLNMQQLDGESYIPRNTFGIANDNPVGRPVDILLVAGDTRANAQPGLIVLHTLFAREHNRLCDGYLVANPTAPDEEVFEYARKIVIAELQAITFREYLPATLGRDMPDYKGYDSSVDPSVSNLFATAAFRFGHSQVNTHMWRFDENGTVPRVGHVALREAYFAPERVLSEGGIDPYLRGMVTQRAQEIDALMVDDMRNVLFPVGRVDGLDLSALNIQRGRDHGLPDFNTARKSLKLKFYQDIAQISKNSTVVSQLKSVYPSVDVIDPWVGGLAEDHVNGSELGEFFHKIILDNFEAIRSGDRFWYESFLNQSEIEMVHNLTLSRIVSLNTGVKNFTQAPFFSQRYCVSVEKHQCEPVEEPACPLAGSTDFPRFSMPTANPVPTSAPSLPTRASLLPTSAPALPTSAPAFPTSAPALPATTTASQPTMSPCCLASSHCASQLAVANANLTTSLAGIASLRHTVKQQAGGLTNALALLTNCQNALSTTNNSAGHVIYDLAQNVTALQRRVLTLEANVTITRASLTSATAKISTLSADANQLRKDNHTCHANANLLASQWSSSHANMSAIIATQALEATHLISNLSACKSDLGTEKQRNLQLNKNLTSLRASCQSFRNKSHLDLQTLRQAFQANVSLIQMQCSSSQQLLSAKLVSCQNALHFLNQSVPTLLPHGTAQQLKQLQDQLLQVSMNFTQSIAACGSSAAKLQSLYNDAVANATTTRTMLHACQAAAAAALVSSTSTAAPTTTSMTHTSAGVSIQTDCTTTVVTAGTTQSSTTDSKTAAQISWLNRRVKDLESEKDMYRENITWHKWRYENISHEYKIQHKKVEDLQSQLATATATSNTGNGCDSAWHVIAQSTEGKLLLAFIAVFVVLSALLAALLCRTAQFWDRRRLKSDKIVTFGKQKVTTAVKPIVMVNNRQYGESLAQQYDQFQ